MPVSINGNGSVVGITSVTGAGMDLIVPTSVAGAGVTLSGGQISFASATSVSVNGCFTSLYENYAYVLNCPSGSGAITYRYRISGTDNSTTAYVARSVYVAASATPAVVYATGLTAGLAITLSGANSFEGRIMSPALVQPTTLTSSWYVGGNGGFASEVFTSATAFDGITFLATSLTGKLRIYGLRDS